MEGINGLAGKGGLQTAAVPLIDELRCIRADLMQMRHRTELLSQKLVGSSLKAIQSATPDSVDNVQSLVQTIKMLVAAIDKQIDVHHEIIGDTGCKMEEGTKAIA